MRGIEIVSHSIFKGYAEFYLHKKLFSHIEPLGLKTSSDGSILILVKTDLKNKF